MRSHEALFFSLMVTNCSGERSFSSFKRIALTNASICV